jgi:hypothetical protein
MPVSEREGFKICPRTPKPCLYQRDKVTQSFEMSTYPGDRRQQNMSLDVKALTIAEKESNKICQKH